MRLLNISKFKKTCCYKIQYKLTAFSSQSLFRLGSFLNGSTLLYSIQLDKLKTDFLIPVKNQKFKLCRIPSLFNELCDGLVFINKFFTPINNSYLLESSLPSQRTKFTLLKSPHVFKKARTQLELKKYFNSYCFLFKFNLSFKFSKQLYFFFLKQYFPYNIALFSKFIKKIKYSLN